MSQKNTQKNTTVVCHRAICGDDEQAICGDYEQAICGLQFKENSDRLRSELCARYGQWLIMNK